MELIACAMKVLGSGMIRLNHDWSGVEFKGEVVPLRNGKAKSVEFTWDNKPPAPASLTVMDTVSDVINDIPAPGGYGYSISHWDLGTSGVRVTVRPNKKW